MNSWRISPVGIPLPETNSKSTWKLMVGTRSFPFGVAFFQVSFMKEYPLLGTITYPLTLWHFWRLGGDNSNSFGIFTPKIGEDYHFDSYVSTGLVQPPTSWGSTRRLFSFSIATVVAIPSGAESPQPSGRILSFCAAVSVKWLVSGDQRDIWQMSWNIAEQTNQPIHQSVNQSINRSISRSIRKSVNQSVNSRINLYIYQFQQFSNRHCNITILFSGKCSQNKTATEDAPKTKQQQLPNFLKGTTTSTEISAMIRQTRWIFHDTSRCWDCFFK